MSTWASQTPCTGSSERVTFVARSQLRARPSSAAALTADSTTSATALYISRTYRAEVVNARLTEAAPVHARGIFDLFVVRLDDQELAVLESALKKLTLHCTFG